MNNDSSRYVLKTQTGSLPSKESDSSPCSSYELLGIGFGPSNLSVAIALEEDHVGRVIENFHFLEMKSRFAWHPHMMLRGATMQVSFLKDLATLRNPQSRFTFVNYLKEQGRLNHFVNLREFFPTRVEYNAYLSWAAEAFAHKVSYSRCVEKIIPVYDAQYNSLVSLDIIVTNMASKEVERYRARNIVLASGGTPYVPLCMKNLLGQHVFHSSEFLERIRTGYEQRNSQYRFLVVGGGQSSAEITKHLLDTYPNATVTVVMKEVGFKAADDTCFVNEVFYPAMVGLFYQMPSLRRSEFLTSTAQTNYAVVDADLIKEIYHEHYLEKIEGRQRLYLHHFSEVVELKDKGQCLTATIDDGISGVTHAVFDGVILATGYRRTAHELLLSNLEDHIIRDEHGSIAIGRDYRIAMKSSNVRIYLQGFCEETHGISDTLLSVLPYRADEIVDSLNQHARSRILLNGKNV